MDQKIEISEFEVWRTQLDDYITGLCWSPDTKWLCGCTGSGDVMLINSEDESERIFKQAHSFGIISMAHSPKENLFVTVGQDGKIKLWETPTGKVLKVLEGGSQWVEHVEWSLDGIFFATSSGKFLRVWNKNGDLVVSFDTHESTISAITWNPDGQHISTACYGGVKTFNIPKKELIEVFPWANSMISLALSPDKKFMIAGTQDSRLHFWPLPFVPEQDLEMSGYPGKVKCLEWDYQSRFLATDSYQEIIIWRFEGKPPVGQKPLVLPGHTTRITAMKFQHKEDILASGDLGGLLLFWIPIMSDKFITGGQLESEISTLCWSPDDRQIAVGTRNGHIVIFDSPA